MAHVLPPPPPTEDAPPLDPNISSNFLTLPNSHTMFYLAAGPLEGGLVVFVHGWPELSRSWRHQLSVLGNLGYRAIAPDMRGYGQSYIPHTKQEVEIEHNVNDLLALLNILRGATSTAVFIGHDWGAPIVWTLAQCYPERVRGAGGVCIPASPPKKPQAPISVDVYRAKADRHQWDYFVHHYDNTQASCEELDADIPTTVTACFQGSYSPPPPRMWNQYLSMFDQVQRFNARTRTRGEAQVELNSWFPATMSAVKHLIHRDSRVVDAQDVACYAASIARNGGFEIPNFYYLNHQANDDFQRTHTVNGGVLGMPTLMITAEYDAVCTPSISKHMDQLCLKLTRGHVFCGHWAQQERWREVNSIVVGWLFKIGCWPGKEAMLASKI